MTTYESGTKPRYDGGGSEFGNVHRELPLNYGMFDIDRMQATANVKLELTRQNAAFIEYRTRWNDESNSIDFKAVFEVKHGMTDSVKKALNMKKGTALWAQAEMAKKLQARFFVVVATDGIQPFSFYELSDTGDMVFSGALEYNNDGKKQAIEEFWAYLGLS